MGSVQHWDLSLSVCIKLKAPSSAWESFCCFPVPDWNTKRMWQNQINQNSGVSALLSPLGRHWSTLNIKNMGAFYFMKIIKIFLLTPPKFVCWERIEKEEPARSKRFYSQPFPSSLCLYRQVLIFRLFFSYFSVFKAAVTLPASLDLFLYHLGSVLLFPLRHKRIPRKFPQLTKESDPSCMCPLPLLLSTMLDAL